MTHFVVGPTQPYVSSATCSFTVSSSCLSLLSSISFFFNNLRWLICCPALREFLNPSQCLSCLLDETWMDVSYPQFVDPSANYKKLNCQHFPLFWEEFLPGAADEWWRMRCSQDPGNKRTPDPHPALLNIVHHTVCSQSASTLYFTLAHFTLYTVYWLPCESRMSVFYFCPSL